MSKIYKDKLPPKTKLSLKDINGKITSSYRGGNWFILG